MALFKCKMCGGDLNVQDGVSVVECGYCGTRQTVAATDDEKRVNLYNRANRLRMNSEFDKASGLYEQIVAEFPDESEAYWGLCLCNYGIEYVDDPVTSAKIPTIHRASFEKMRKDENYERAVENAVDETARLVYQQQAQEIDRIMGEVLAISRNEQPYDIFICYKETALTGGRSVDSVLAQDVYERLTERGYKVFFSRITLEDKLGTQYEPYIFAALNSARVMLAFGTDYEHFNAVWVKNEWRRFWKLAAADKTKVLIPCYKDMDPYDLPEEFKYLQAQDMGKVGALQDLLRGIDKIFGKTAGATATNKNEVSNNSLLKRAFLSLEDSDWEKADQLCERVLDSDPENGNAYFAKLLAELHVRTPNELSGCVYFPEQSPNYAKALRFLDENTAATLKQCNDYILARNGKQYVSKPAIPMQAPQQPALPDEVLRQQRYQAYLQAYPIILQKDEIQEQYEIERETVEYWEKDVKHQQKRIRIGLPLVVICGILSFTTLVPIAFPLGLIGLIPCVFGVLGIRSSKRALRKHQRLFAELTQQVNYISSIPPFAG